MNKTELILTQPTKQSDDTDTTLYNFILHINKTYKYKLIVVIRTVCNYLISNS